MTWECHTLIYEAKAPIHIGFRRQGIMTRTRYFILGRNFWGAVTARLSRKIMNNYDTKIYKEVGDFVREAIIFTHFYIVERDEPSGDVRILYPQYRDSLKYGCLAENEFESRYISSYVSTALEKSYKSAEEKSLHEIEFIKPKYLKNNRILPTQFFGHALIRNSYVDTYKELKEDLVEYLNIEKLRDVISDLWVGGERNYGFGRIQLIETNESGKNRIFNKYEINNDLGIVFDNRDEILALSHVKYGGIKVLKGDIEPLVGREWKNGKGTGVKVSGVEICLTPGTVFELEEGQRITIGDYGIWKVESTTLL